MHGELRKARCLSCESVHIWEEDIATGDVCPACGEEDALRPHIVWFGEMPFAMNKIDAALARCDLFISIGTSGNVYPAAGFVETINYYGRAHSVELNLEPSLGSRNFAETRHGPATKIVTQYVDELLAKP
jgi:NAD-dependent deacetylase